MRGRGWSKYGAKKTVVDGITFPSKLEAKRYGELLILQKAGAISCLKRQVPFDLEVNGHLICRYIADFTYTQSATGEIVCEDAKGVMTPAFRLKAKLMEAVHGIVIQVWTGRRQSAPGAAKGQSWLRIAAKRTRKTSSRGGG